MEAGQVIIFATLIHSFYTYTIISAIPSQLMGQDMIIFSHCAFQLC